MQLSLASDHAGFLLKENIKKYFSNQQISYQDLGCYTEDAVDYTDITHSLVEEVLKNESNKGILICGSGLGVTIAANRFSKIYATLCHDTHSAEMARKHNNSNVLTLAARVLEKEIALKIIDTWLNTEFEGGRHTRRIKKIK